MTDQVTFSSQILGYGIELNEFGNEGAVQYFV